MNIFGSKLWALTGAERRLAGRRADSCNTAPGVGPRVVLAPRSLLHCFFGISAAEFSKRIVSRGQNAT